jgi:heat shock protein HslJ
MRPSLVGTFWQLTAVGDGTNRRPRVAGTVPTLQFGADGRFVADTGCNSLGGTWEAGHDGTVRLSAGPMTMRACIDDDARRQEAAIVDGFGAARSTSRDDARLSLLDGTGAVVLVYVELSAALDGTSWSVTGVNTGDAVVSSALTERLTLHLGSDGVASGHSGCNTFRARYSAEGDRLGFDAVVSTRMACDPEVMELERAYLTALGHVTAVRRHRAALGHVEGAGTTQVTLGPHPDHTDRP